MQVATDMLQRTKDVSDCISSASHCIVLVLPDANPKHLYGIIRQLCNRQPRYYYKHGAVRKVLSLLMQARMHLVCISVGKERY
jgi:hypothetical protein